MALTAEIARAVLAQAKNDETYEAPIPEDDATAISEANELVEQARAAWEANVRGPEVEAILNIANSGDEDGDPDDDPSGDDPEAEGGEEENLAEIEPWEDYDKDKVATIKEGLEVSKAEDEPEDFLALCRHIWEYESANKARDGVLKFLSTIAEGDDAPTEAEAEGDPPADPEDEAGSGDAAGDEGGEGDGTEAEAAAGAEGADADPDASGEAEGGGGEEAADAEAGAEAEPFVLTITKDQIIEALSTGSVEIEIA